ncbi:MAG TPA: polysaccharide deacetylase family protein [Desulfomonilia bacterium]
MPELALKVDIDTYRGFRDGLPSLLKTLGERNLKASFFVTFGPDRSGLAIIQMFRPRFFMKMLKSNAPGTYGIETALYGTLLKAPMIASANPEAVRQIAELGHETACHAWDHRLWQDWLGIMGRKGIHEWFRKMVGAYMDATGTAPGAFGAPGWMMNTSALKEAAAWGFKYLSCTRAQVPFIFEENGLLEIPSNIPCIEEVGTDGVLTALEKNAGSSVPQVLPVHTEIEGGAFKADFERILDKAAALGYNIRKLCDIAEGIDRSRLEIRPLRKALLAGRAFSCSV